MTEYLRQKPRGVIRDLPPEEAEGAYTDASNVVFVDEAAMRMDGYGAVFGVPLGAPQFLLPVIAPLQRYWIYGHAGGVGVTDGITHWDITPTSWLGGGFTIDDWSGTTLNGLPVLNNGTGAPHWWNWDTGAIMTRLPDWPVGVTCRLIRDYKYHLVALNIVDNSVEYPNRFRWSSAAEPGLVPASWTPAPDNDAGDNILASTPGAITDAHPLRDGLMIYKQSSAFLMSFIGGNFVFDTRRKFAAVGALTAECVAEFKGSNLVLTDGDVVITDGHNYDSIVDRRIRNEIFNSIDPEYYARAQVVYYKATETVWICWPDTGNEYLTRAAVWDTVADEWGLIELPNVAYIGRGLIGTPTESSTWNDDAGAWDNDLTVWNERAYNPTQDGLLMAREAETDLLAVGLDSTGADGEPLEAYLEKVGMHFGDAERVKTAVALWPKITGTPGDVLQFRLGGQMWRDDPVTWTANIPFVIGTDDKVDGFATGRFLSMRVVSLSAGIWRMHGFNIELQVKGKY